MNRARLWLLLGSALYGLPLACLDTRLIPARPVEAGGGSSAGSETAAAGAAGEAGEAEAGQGGAGASGGSPGAGAGGGITAGTAPVAGSAGTSQGGAPHRVTWLTLQGNEAPAGAAVNDELQIAGRFYAYADDCAELDWDETTRCASGKLCEPLGGENWGVAVGFDFKATGEDDSPANAKLTWDPRDVGAVGVSFEIGGDKLAPGLELWVLNMDPIWDGTCTAQTCEIAGPPDGRAGVPLHGELFFDNMQKDDWGGGGVYYQYSPAAVFALQFKLPAIVVGAASFSFCIDALGIIR